MPPSAACARTRTPSEIVRETSGGSAKPPPRTSVKLTHPDRVYWPDAGVTKEGLAQYYAEVWRHMAPFVVGRPLALVRCPQGIAGQCFFQKHAWQGLSRSIRQVRDPQDPEEALLAIDDLDGLIGLVQAAVLEIHPWGASLPNLDQPDMIIMDLDPGEAVSWPEVIAAAVEVRERLAAVGMPSFVKTSGGKGLHVVAPLKPKAAWPAVKAFTKSIADAMAGDSPERFVATDHQVEAARQDPGRLSAQRARLDGRGGLFHPGPGRRAGVDAAGLGRARPGHRSRLLHGRQHPDAAGPPHGRSMGRFSRQCRAAAGREIAPEAGSLSTRQRSGPHVWGVWPKPGSAV